MTAEFTRFDAASYLKTPEEMAAYLDACFEEDSGDGALVRRCHGAWAEHHHQPEVNM